MKRVFQFIFLILVYLPITHAQSIDWGTKGQSTILRGPVKKVIVKRFFNKTDSKSIYELPGDTMLFDHTHERKNSLNPDYSDFYFYIVIDFLSTNGGIDKSFPIVKGLKIISEFDAEGEILGRLYKSSYKENGHLFLKDEYKYVEKDHMYKLSISNSKNIILIREDHIYFNNRLDEVNFYKFHNSLDVDIMFTDYAYDKHGNWIKRTGYRKSVYNVVIGIITETRSISYW